MDTWLFSPPVSTLGQVTAKELRSLVSLPWSQLVELFTSTASKNVNNVLEGSIAAGLIFTVIDVSSHWELE
jgi:hypothetical protein